MAVATVVATVVAMAVAITMAEDEGVMIKSRQQN